MSINIDHLKAVVDNLQDQDELDVGFTRTYDNVREWLIRPVLSNPSGCGFDATFVDRLMPMIVDQIRQGVLQFGPEDGRKFDIYLRDRCREYERDILNESAKVREALFQKEYIYQQREGLNLISDYISTIKLLKRGILWLSITTVLSLSVAMLVLLPWLRSLLSYLFPGGS